MISKPAETVVIENEIDLQVGYASGWMVAAVASLISALPQYEDFESTVDPNTYERMLNDPAAGSAVDTLIDFVLDGDMRLQAATAPPRFGNENPEQLRRADESARVAEFCQASLDGMATPIGGVLEEMMLALALGRQTAEITFRPDAGGKLVHESIAVRPRKNVLPVQDLSMSLTGYLVKLAEVASLDPISGPVVDESVVFPKTKFWTLVHKPRHGRMDGTSVLRRAYNAWYIKTNVWPVFFKYMMQFGSPSLISTIKDSSKAQSLVSGTGAAKVNLLKEVQTLVQTFYQSGSYLVLPEGVDVTTLEAQGDGQAFKFGIDMLEREITRAILRQTRATMEAEHGSKADSNTAYDVLGKYINRLRRWVCDSFRSQVLRPLVEINFGSDVAAVATPYATLGTSDIADFARDAGAFATLHNAGLLADDQIEAMDERLGLPPRNMEAWLADREMDRAAATQIARDAGVLNDPLD